MHKQNVWSIDSRRSNDRPFSLNSEHFFDGASSSSLLQAVCVPSRVAT